MATVAVLSFFSTDRRVHLITVTRFLFRSLLAVNRFPAFLRFASGGAGSLEDGSLLAALDGFDGFEFFAGRVFVCLFAGPVSFDVDAGRFLLPVVLIDPGVAIAENEMKTKFVRNVSMGILILVWIIEK